MNFQNNFALNTKNAKSFSVIFPIILKKWKLFIISLTAIIASLILFFVIIIPRFQKNAILKKDVDYKKTILLKLQAKLNELEGIDEYSLKEKVDFSLTALPKSKDVLKTASELKGLAWKGQVFLETLEVNPGSIATESSIPTQNPGLSAVSFKLVVIGEKEKIVSFINNLELSLPLINVKSFKITNFEQFSKVQLTVETYFAAPPRELGKIEAPLAKLTKKEEEVYEDFKKMEVYDEKSLPTESIVATPSAGGERVDPFAE